VIVEDGIAKMPDKTCFAGSVATCDRMVRTLMRDADLPLWEAVRASSYLPALFMGLGETTGSIRVGKQADLLVLGRDITVKRVLYQGRKCCRHRPTQEP
jgi:N-acetylglucosamine-6-phosphate deacetylase